MHSTYLNDLQAIAYPLLGDVARPFPDCVLTGLSVYVLQPHDDDPDKNNLVLSQLTVTDTSLSCVFTIGSKIACTCNIDYKSTSICSLTAVDVDCMGYLAVGVIPETCRGTFNGPFRLDQSCVTYKNEINVVKTLVINDEAVYMQPSLNIAITGNLTVERDADDEDGNRVYNIKAYCKKDEFGELGTIQGPYEWLVDADESAEMVTSINGISTLNKGKPTKLIFRISEHDIKTLYKSTGEQKLDWEWMHDFAIDYAYPCIFNITGTELKTSNIDVNSSLCSLYSVSDSVLVLTVSGTNRALTCTDYEEDNALDVINTDTVVYPVLEKELERLADTKAMTDKRRTNLTLGYL